MRSPPLVKADGLVLGFATGATSVPMSRTEPSHTKSRSFLVNTAHENFDHNVFTQKQGLYF